MIRALTIDDIPALLGIGRQMHAESSIYRHYLFNEAGTETFLRALLEGRLSKATFTKGAFTASGELVGVFLGVAMKDPFVVAMVADEALFYVSKPYRAKGYGVMLARSFKTWADTNGYDIVRFGVSAGVADKEVSALLGRMGYPATGTMHVVRR